ncbi:hypothetical protein PORY_000614 [Pneumocystis oryctolagi]|uniref:Uncharacterized protein n=1 Tax=Pneumocystis oryctolagi TaxID=42067 RepID=A0ACB7CIP5_9ASCO|nr:hypothetical protein PORY_000614 [Pneumocystis oryctolagi]
MKLQEKKEKTKNTFAQKSETESIRERSKRKRLFSKVFLNNPYNIQWPKVNEEDQKIILEKILNLFLSLSDHKNQDKISEKKDERKTIKNLKNTPITEEHKNEFDKSTFLENKMDKKTFMAKYMTLGINETTKRLEMYSKMGIPYSAPSYLKIPKKTDETCISMFENNKSMDILKVVLVCREDIHSNILYSHFPILCGIVNEVFSKIETLNCGSQSGIRLVTLPKGSEQQLSKAIGFKRLAAIGIMKNTPHSEEIIDYIFKKIPPVHIPWLTYPIKFQPTSITHTLYEQ